MRSRNRPEVIPETLAEWTEVVHALHALGYAELGLVPPVEHPAILMQATLQQVFCPMSPTEVYSDHQPTFTPRSPEEENWIPIDILLGCYQPKTRTIRIFHRNIQHFAGAEFHCSDTDLEAIVRLHEYAHALVHLGVFWSKVSAIIREYPPGRESDWKPFLRARSRAFRSLPGDAHEFLAQVLCWAAIGASQPLPRRDSLQELFVAVMNRQPPEYHLSPDILGKALYGDPTAMLWWARNTPRRKPSRHLSHRELVQALLRRTFP